MKIFAALLFFIFSMNTRAFAQEVSVLKEFAVLDSTASALEKAKKLGEAEKTWKNALSLAQNNSFKKDSLSHFFLKRLYIFYYKNKNFQQSTLYSAQAIAISKSIFAGKSKEYGEDLTNLGVLKSDLGEIEEAVQLYDLALVETELTVGKKNKIYANICQKKGGLLAKMNRLMEAEDLFKQSFAIQQEVTGKEHPDYALACVGYASFLFSQFLFEKGLKYLEEALPIYEKNFGKKHLAYAGTLNNMSNAHLRLKNFHFADSLLNISAQIRKEKLGEESLDYAQSLNNRGLLQQEMNNFEKASELFEEARKIKLKILGEEHPDYARALFNLANVLKFNKQKERALQLYEQALRIQALRLGDFHDDYSKTCMNISTIYAEDGNWAKAKQYSQKTTENKKRYIRSIYLTLSENDKLTFVKSNQSELNAHFLTFQEDETEEEKEKYYNLLLFQKGMLYSSAQKIKKIILESKDSTLIKSYQQLLEAKKQYGIAISTLGTQNNAAVLFEEISEREKQIFKHQLLQKETDIFEPITLENVRKNLKKNEILIDVLTLRNDKKNQYFVFFIPGNLSKKVNILRFDMSDKEHKQILSFYRSAVNFNVKDTLTYQFLWQKIEQELKKMKVRKNTEIIFSPDGIYNQINPNTIFNPKKNRFLIDEYSFFNVSSGRIIAQEGIADKREEDFKNYQIFLFGNPKFDDENEKTEEPAVRKDRSRALFNSILQKGVKVAELPGTEKEVAKISELISQEGIKNQVFTGVSASEENFKKMQNVHIVHIATHGFFTPSDDFAKLNTIAEAERMFLLKNVFLRSGLLMSGCVSDKNDNENDGILTAQEVVNTSLDNTELVVLSACETGLGEIENGEGVFGLPRAFLNAGAKNIIMSLWKVDDKLTSDLMIAFYKELLKTKIAHKALRKAQIAIRKTNPEVKYWGAFVLMSGRKF